MSRPPFPTVTHVVDQAAIDAYAALSGDFNPLHTDPAFAAAGPFGTIVAHGPIALQTVFEAVGRWLGVESAPVPAGVSVDASFRAPTRVGDRLVCSASSDVVDHGGVLSVSVACVNQDGAPVVQALVVVPRELVAG